MSEHGGETSVPSFQIVIRLRPDYAYSTTREGESAADVGPFSTLQCNYFQNIQEQAAHHYHNGYKVHRKLILCRELERSQTRVSYEYYL